MSEHDTEQWFSRLAAQAQRLADDYFRAALAKGLRWLGVNCLDRRDRDPVRDRHERINR
jgi:hypothetical protein